jgi:hypothetical protein
MAGRRILFNEHHHNLRVYCSRNIKKDGVIKTYSMNFETWPSGVPCDPAGVSWLWPCSASVPFCDVWKLKCPKASAF